MRGNTVYSCLMVECMAALTRCLKVREGERGGEGKGGERGKSATAQTENYRDGRRAVGTTGWLRLRCERTVKGLMGIIFGADDN